MANIKAIDVNTVHRICSGQVVLTLGVAVKELVENSLDSGATAIEVRLKEFGSEAVEVSDNGSGISTKNFESLCLKHYTSKLEEFEDLLNVQTFGFRGEALSSLCALSLLTVTTCEKGSNIGWKLEFDHSGKLVKQIQCSRPVGTTVTLLNLFSSLPVRHKEFIKNLRREFTKMTTMLTGYCLISKGTRITCTNMSGGKLSTVLSTRGGTSLKDNFTLIFGIKSWQGVVVVETVRPSEDILAEFGLSLNDVAGYSSDSDWPFNFEGFVSSCAHGAGRSCSDRQFYFINWRPCDPARISKLVNEVYHSYNRNQNPCVVLNIITQAGEIDINVTPDKRQLMINNEKILLATLKASLNQLYRDVPSTFTLQNTSVMHRSSSTLSAASSADDGKSNWRSSLARFAANTGTSWSSSKQNSSPGEKRKLSAPTPVSKQKRLDEFVVRPSVADAYITLLAPADLKDPTEDVPVSDEEVSIYEPVSADVKDELEDVVIPDEEVTVVETSEAPHIIESVEELEEILEEILPEEKPPLSSQTFCKPKVDLTFNMELLRQALSSSTEATSEHREGKVFLTRIGPDSTEAAEAELSRQIGQSDFEKMEVVGQFNLGFIVAKLNKDLFIVDQHAADEKYNFETLQRTTRLQPQKLVCPKPLCLTAANESLLADHLEVFRRNGFDFVINMEEDATKRVALSCVPMSGNWFFGPGDVDELLFLLQDSPILSSSQDDGKDDLSEALMARYRPSRVRSMFASRACRKAVMVGDPLTSPQMKKLLNQLSHLQQPWSCPHGRPTMRHLINLEMLR